MRNCTEQEPVATPPKYVGAVENAARLLRRLSERPGPAGAAALARETGLNTSTAFNILRTLVKEGLVAFDPVDKTYRPGLGLLDFSAPLLGAGQADLIHPELSRLSAEHRVMLGLWAITAAERIVLRERVISAQGIVRVDMAPGARLPAWAGAVGRCYAAARNLPREALRARYDALRWHAPPGFEAYAEQVADARRDGVARDRAELFHGLDTVAAVIPDHEGTPRFGVSAICISGQLDEAAMAGLAADLRDTAALIAARLWGAAAPRAGA
jgi:DNA-binding IclR family transcriptional regulator